MGGGEAPSEIGDGVGFMWVFGDGWERLVIRGGEGHYLGSDSGLTTMQLLHPLGYL